MTIRIYEKGTHKQISKNVNLDEIECHCTFKSCVATIVVSELYDRFEILREKCGNVPLIITSGYRCPSHNNSLKDSAKLSRHIAGLALDIKYPSIFDVSNEDFERYCAEIFDFIKLYPGRIHVDISNY